MSVRSVQRALDELLEAGLITKKHNYRSNRSQTSNIYTIIAAVEDRAVAAVSNAQLKLRDMRKRLECSQRRQAQTSLLSADSSSGGTVNDTAVSTNLLSSLINRVSPASKKHVRPGITIIASPSAESVQRSENSKTQLE